MRIGIGVDTHRLVPGRPLILGGVEIPNALGLDGHSDADVLTHAVVDAVLGALAEGNIGTFFPPMDDQWKNADSRIFLRHAMELAASRGYEVSNVDATILAEAPRLNPHIDAIRTSLAETMQVPRRDISVKATTAEGMGALGRGEGMSCTAVVLLRRATDGPGDAGAGP